MTFLIFFLVLHFHFYLIEFFFSYIGVVIFIVTQIYIYFTLKEKVKIAKNGYDFFFGIEINVRNVNVCTMYIFLYVSYLGSGVLSIVQQQQQQDFRAMIIKSIKKLIWDIQKRNIFIRHELSMVSCHSLYSKFVVYIK